MSRPPDDGNQGRSSSPRARRQHGDGSLLARSGPTALWLIPALLVAACAADVPLPGQPAPMLEASGITRYGDSLLVVDDQWKGVYYRYRLRGNEGSVIVLDPDDMEKVVLPQANIATDLEAIDVLADGRAVVLSERLRALFSLEGVVADYDAPLSEFGKRGLEGLAVHRLPDKASRIAVLWEGGYPEYYHVPEQLRAQVGRKAMQPLIQVHTLNKGDKEVLVRGEALIPLDVPLPIGDEPAAQRFRAPDLVWHRQSDGSWGFIILLSSQDSVDRPHYMYHWLQRFSGDGTRIGDPIDLDQVVPSELQGVNWEGLGWFEDGESLVLVHESHPRPNAVAYVLALPGDWKGPIQNEPAHSDHVKGKSR